MGYWVKVDVIGRKLGGWKEGWYEGEEWVVRKGGLCTLRHMSPGHYEVVISAIWTEQKCASVACFGASKTIYIIIIIIFFLKFHIFKNN